MDAKATAAPLAAKQQYTVVVTGFEVNKKHPTNKTNNPAGLIAAIMPPLLASGDALNVSGVDVQIVKDIKDEWIMLPSSFAKMRQNIKDMHEQYGDQADLWIHLGRMGDSGYYTIERRAFSQDFSSSWGAPSGYYHNLSSIDDTGHTIGPNPWAGKVPIGLGTEIDVTRVVAEADKVFQKDNSGQNSNVAPYIRSHIEAGEAACGFVFYESLANCWIAGRKGHALFCHVPPQVDQETLETGRDAILAIIGASIAWLVADSKTPEPSRGPSKKRQRFYDEH